MVSKATARASRTMILAAVLATASCDFGRSNEPVRVVGVKVVPQSLQLSGVGDEASITATIFPSDATDRSLTWESSDAAIVSVDAAGHITAHAIGDGVFITAYTHDGHHQASANVTVNP